MLKKFVRESDEEGEKNGKKKIAKLLILVLREEKRYAKTRRRE